MAKTLLQDMVVVKHPTQQKEKLGDKNFNQKTNHTKKGYKYRMYFVALVSIVFLLFALSFLFSGVTINITPKIEEISLNENLTAERDSTNKSSLPFDLVVISGEEEKLIQSGAEKDVSIVATGTVIIYNSYSTSSQVLDIDTRLEGSNGKIYKTTKKITVPGITKDNKPGSIEVNIYAALPGKEYNSGPLDFKIFGFKGSSKYDKFYARSKGDIVGGFEGKSIVISDLEKVSIISELKASLEIKLLQKITDQIPKGFILLNDAKFLDIDEENTSFTPTENNTITVNIKGKLYGFLFDENKLTKKIAEDIIDNYDGSEIYIPNIKDLVFSLTNKDNQSFINVKNLNFTLLGTPKIIWKVDEQKFINDILGKKKSDFNQILSQYSNIKFAELILRPFWKSTFPEINKNIKIIVNYPIN